MGIHATIEGWAMQKQILVAVSTMAVVAGAVGFAAPAAAVEDVVPGANPAPWVMPEVRSMLLDHAVDAVLGVTGPAELDLRLISAGNQNVFNFTNWDVCRQSPSAGKEISQKTKRAILYVSRPGTC